MLIVRKIQLLLPQIKLFDTLKLHTVTQFLQTKNLRAVQEFHANLIRASLFSISPNVQTNLLFAYTACIDGGSVRILTNFLKCLNPSNPVPFNEIISNFSQHGSDCFALRTFSFMHYNSVLADSYTLCSSLKSTSYFKNVCFGKMLHANVVKSGWLGSVFVGSALVDFYGKSTCMNDAALVFDEIPMKNTVCVNALLSGYAEAKMWDQVIELVSLMPSLRLEVDNFSMAAALRACSGLCALELGKQVHAHGLRSILEARDDVFLNSLLIETYGKCGLVDTAKKVFNMMGDGVGVRKRDVVLWTSILGVYGRFGNYTEVTRLFKHMLMEGICPDGVSFLTVISACGYTGQVDVGMEYFESMIYDYGLVPNPEHYSCIVNLLCRAGELERACTFISKIPYNGGKSFPVSMWAALLSACNERGNVNLGMWAAHRALELEPENGGVYVLLSNMCASSGMWSEIEHLRELMKTRALKKDTGWSCIGTTSRLQKKMSVLNMPLGLLTNFSS